MTVPQILEKVNDLSQGNDIVEVYIWDKVSFAITMVDLDSLQSRLSQLSTTEGVLGAIYYTGLDVPGREDFTTDAQGLNSSKLSSTQQSTAESGCDRNTLALASFCRETRKPFL